jgi:hypothetical protein
LNQQEKLGALVDGMRSMVALNENACKISQTYVPRTKGVHLRMLVGA